MKCRNYDSEYRDINITKIVYSGKNVTVEDFYKIASRNQSRNGYNADFGERHDYTNLSGASPDIDSNFILARDNAKLDFCVILNHDHCGVGKDELRELLGRKDTITIIHTTSFLHSGCDFNSMPLDLMTPLIEACSRLVASEFFGNENPAKIETVGGFWQDAMKTGAKMGCISGSDDYHGFSGLVLPNEYIDDHKNDNLRYKNPSAVAVLAKSLTREDILQAIRKKMLCNHGSKN